MDFITGNSFPWGLVRREISVIPVSFGIFIQNLQTRSWKSFWGHENTLPLVNAMTGCDLTPEIQRPALTLSAENLPTLFGETCSECWLLSPEYVQGYRPEPTKVAAPDDIIAWHILKMTWNE